MNRTLKLVTAWVALFPFASLAQPPSSQDARPQEGPIIELGSQVTGNQEQPQVFHVVPWQSPQMSVPGYNPLSSQLQDVFGHLERDELQRQLQQSENIRESGG